MCDWIALIQRRPLRLGWRTRLPPREGFSWAMKWAGLDGGEREESIMPWDQHRYRHRGGLSMALGFRAVPYIWHGVPGPWSLPMQEHPLSFPPSLCLDCPFRLTSLLPFQGCPPAMPVPRTSLSLPRDVSLTSSSLLPQPCN